MAQALHQPVDVQTAPDFTEFARRSLDQSYDMVVTSGHQAELLRADGGYLPLVTYRADFLAVMVMDKAMPLATPKDLDGKVVLGLNPSSLVTIWGQHWLAENHVAPQTIRYISAADSVGQLVLAGDAVAGFMSLANFQTLPAETRDALRIEERSPAMAGRVYMLNARQGAIKEKVLSALGTFAESAEGQRYFEEFKLGGYRPVTTSELQRMKPYADEVRQVLGRTGP